MMKKRKMLVSTFILLLVFLISNINAGEKIKSTVSTRKVKFLRYLTGKDVGAPKDIQNCFSIFVDKERGVLYTGATPAGPVFRFDTKDNFKFLDVIADSKKIKFTYLLDISVDRNGNIFLLDSEINVIYVFDNQGALKQTIKPRESRASNRGLSIISLDFSSKGDMYIADKAGKGIQVMDWEGNYLYQIKKAKYEKLDFGFPSVSTVRINSQDEIFLFDNLISRIIKFNLKGKTLTVFGGRGDVAGKFIDATKMTIDQKDRIYILESMTGTVQVFDKDGNFLHILVDENGERLELINPSDIEIDNQGYIFVLERIKNRIAVLKFVD